MGPLLLARHPERLTSKERPKQRQIKDISITLPKNLVFQNSKSDLLSQRYKEANRLPKSIKTIVVSACMTFY